MSDFGDWQTLAINLAGVVALIVALGWLARRIPGLMGRSNGSLRVVATLPLGQKERLVLVAAGERQLLLGVAPGSVQLLKEGPAESHVVPLTPVAQREAG